MNTQHPFALVGNGGEEHVGAHFRRAAEEAGLPVLFLDIRRAEEGSAIERKINWWLRGKRPSRLSEFSAEAVAQCRDSHAKAILSTGLAPLNAASLKQLGAAGVTRINFLTDDPWNPAHHAPWFLEALPNYDWVFSPRRANIEDLRRWGCRNVAHLPFGYATHLHFREDAVQPELACDVLFAGGADRDRTPLITALIRGGLSVGLYGGYWDRYAETKPFARGMADAGLIRRAMANASIALCLVRRANRDGHSMRSFEAPAMGACLLMEWTQEHEDIFGDNGRAALYFRTPQEMVEKALWLVAHPPERARLAAESYRIVTQGENTYRNRLDEVLRAVEFPREMALSAQGHHAG